MTVDQHDPQQYRMQLDNKLTRFKQTMAAAGVSINAIAVHESRPLGFRMRAEFRIWHEDGRAHYAMNRQGEKRPYIIQDFPIGGPLISQFMPPLLEALNSSSILSRKCFSAEFLTTTSGEVLITLIYHRPLDDEWEAEARSLQTELAAGIIGRSRKQKLVLGFDYVTERLQVGDREYSYQQVESGFTQPNAGINKKMLAWASESLASSTSNTDDLLELYCGNGNFTAVLAQHFNQVMATEISKVSVNSALRNFAANHVDNVTVVRMSSEEFTQALNKERPFRRLANIDLDSYNFSTVFVDPPRGGLDTETEKLVSRFDRILYISCNPETLAANLSQITQTHTIESVAVFDQFPWTDHLESGVLLTLKPEGANPLIS
ncbi:MAG: tRNA (uridine(54)-C5)-methyltransferase TrmA [Porticoccaceae bacterium]|nr:tRNA (uridine(54)-C5)-methyltransferase TrmA [Porticoccaceae bacterium]MDG1311044.1 tRNA (uridine(54)-C5)-methyltransferase TrmA [Porticoccaceae bacterium]